MNILFIAALVISIVLFFAAMAIAAVWVYKDARQRGLQAGLWVLVVILSGNFIGFILYLVIGRKQQNVVCEQCGAPTAQGTFCSACGEKINARHEVIKTNKSLPVICIACIALAFVSLALCVGSVFMFDGFNLQYQYSNYQSNSSGYVKTLTDSSSGDTWKLSYGEASAGYTFQKTYNAKTKTVSLSVEIQCEGTVRIIITQNEVALDETIGTGDYDYDMVSFNTGKISIKIVNVDASDFSSTLKMKT